MAEGHCEHGFVHDENGGSQSIAGKELGKGWQCSKARRGSGSIGYSRECASKRRAGRNGYDSRNAEARHHRLRRDCGISGKVWQQRNAGMREALGAVGSIISKVPVLGQVWDLATAHWTNTSNFEVGVRDTEKLINLSATGVEGLSAKYMQLTERRKAVYDSNVFAVKGGSDLKDQELWKIDQERARVAYQISAAVKDNLIASNSLLSGSEKATKIKQAELATAKEIADIENAGKDATGNTSNDMANTIALQKKGAKLKLEAQKQGIEAEEAIAKSKIRKTVTR